MALTLQDFGICKYCRGQVQVLIEDGEVQDVLHITPEGKDCMPDAAGPGGTQLFIDGTCSACHRPNLYSWREGQRKRVGHHHPELDQRYQERMAAGDEDVDEGMVFPVSALFELTPELRELDQDEED